MKYITPTTTAIIGVLALLTTGCTHYNNNANPVGMVSSTMEEGAGYTVSKIMASSSKAQAAFKRARDYYAQLSERERAKLERLKVYYLAVEVPGYRNRGTGTPVLLYDTRANRLVSNRIIFITAPLKPRQIIMAPREATNMMPGYRYMPGYKCQFIEYIGVGAPVAYP